MMANQHRKACLLLFLIILIPGSVHGQEEAFVPSPRGAVSWNTTRPNFYDRKLTDAEKELLTPLPEDRAAFAAFLRQENTGIFRLHPKGKYEMRRTVSADPTEEIVLPILGGGAYYSFTEKTNKLGPWSDISLNDDRLSARVSNRSIGILTSIGDIPVASVTLNTPGLRFLDDLIPPKKYSDLASLIEKSSPGFEADGFTYSSASDATPGTTYILRSILYKKDGFLVHPNEPYHRLRQYRIGYEGSDVLVAFRVIRRHQDESVTILWKKLRKFRAVKIKSSAQRFAYKEIEELIDQQIVKGMSFAQVIAFLNAHSIEHMGYPEASQDEDVAPEAKGVVYATVLEVERKGRAIFDLRILFSFNEKNELIDWTLKKSRR